MDENKDGVQPTGDQAMPEKNGMSSKLRARWAQLDIRKKRVLVASVAGAFVVGGVIFNVSGPDNLGGTEFHLGKGPGARETPTVEDAQNAPLITKNQKPLTINPEKAPVYGADRDALQRITTDQVVVTFRDESAVARSMQSEQGRLSTTRRLSQAVGADLAYVSSVGENLHVFRITAMLPASGESMPAAARGAELARVIDRLKKIADVAMIEADALQFPALVPNDGAFAQQWSVNASGVGGYGANLVKAWDKTTGSAANVVAIVDTGYTNHSEIAARVLPGYDFVSSVTRANDGNGRDADASDPGDGVSIAEANNPTGPYSGCAPNVSSWHGTHGAGIAAAAGNNGTGIAGANWNASILPVRVLGKCGGYASDIAAGIMWAAGVPVAGVPANPNPAKVVNLSLAGAGPCPATLQTAITAASRAGSIVVVAAGNSNTDAARSSPANCAGVLSVAATGKAGNRAFYSNYGNRVTIAAPGGDSNMDAAEGTILSLSNAGTSAPAGESYAYHQGTSMAAFLVSGSLSLVMASNPKLSAGEAATVMLRRVLPFPQGSDCKVGICGAGILDVGAAVGEGTLMRPDLYLDRVGVVGGALYIPGMPITARVNVVNGGTLGTKKTDTSLKAYLSSVKDSIQNAPLIAEVPLPALDLDPKEFLPGFLRNISIPSNTENGVYYLVFSVNDANTVVEDNRANNVSSTSPITVEMPDLRLEIKQSVAEAPTDVWIRIASNNPRMMGVIGQKDWTYTWSIPSTVFVKRKDRSQAILTLVEPVAGVPISVTINHAASGYTKTISANLTATQAAAYQVDMAKRTSNQYNRAPLTVVLMPIVHGGHPQDRVAKMEWKLNDTPQAVSTRPERAITLPEGNHTVEVKMTSKFGQVATKSETISVAANKTPECNIAVSNNAAKRVYTFIANCMDPDGTVKGYEWYINTMRVAGGRVYTRPYTGTGTWDVELRAVDDAGGEGSAMTQVTF